MADTTDDEGADSGRIVAGHPRIPFNLPVPCFTAWSAAPRGADKPAGFLNTGVEPITDDPAPGVKSGDVAFGARNCRGERRRSIRMRDRIGVFSYAGMSDPMR